MSNKRSAKSFNPRRKAGKTGFRGGKQGSRSEVNKQLSEDIQDIKSIERSRSKTPEINSMFKAETTPTNDPSWYAKNAALLKDAASFPMSYTVGQPLGIDYMTGLKGMMQDPDIRAQFANVIPGIMRMTYVPVLGGDVTLPTSPINVASNALFTFVRKANSGSTNYDAPDLTMYTLAMGSMYNLYATYVRIYGLLRQYQFYNRYIPEALLYSMGFDAHNLQANMADFRYAINVIAYKLGSLCVPSAFAQVERQTWLQSQIFTDGDTAKSQLYYWDAIKYYKWTEGEDSGPNYLMAITPPWLQGDVLPNQVTVKTLLDFANELLTPIMGSESMKIMSGDILKAFGEGALYKISPIAEDYTVTPAYSPEVLSQIENAFFVDYKSLLTNNFNFNITQNLDNLAMGPIIQQSLSAHIPVGTLAADDRGQRTIRPYPYNTRQFLNFHKNDIQPADIMVATRMHPHVTVNLPSGFVDITINSCGTELPMYFSMWTFSNVNNMLQPVSISGPMTSVTALAVENNITGGWRAPETLGVGFKIQNIFTLSVYDWAPIHYVYEMTMADPLPNNDVSTTFVSAFLPICDYDNYTVIDPDDLDPMHETAVLSEYVIGEMNFNS